MPKQLGEASVYTREMGFTERLAYVAAGNGVGQTEYQGWASPGTAETAGGWRIAKFTYDSSNRFIQRDWAGGRDDFNADNTWSARASLTYS